MAVSVVGLLLRILYLNRFGLSLDEALSVHFATSTLEHIISGDQQHNNPPLYFVLLHAWMTVFSNSETSLRMLSVLLGTLLLPIMGILGNHLWDWKTGLIAAALMAVMVFPVHYSQEVRNYSLFLFLSTTSFYFFIRFCEEPTKSRGIWYLTSAVALVYTHTYSVFLLLVQNIYVFLYHRNRDWVVRWLAMQLAILIFAIPWLITLIHKSSALIYKGFWIPKPTVSDLLQAFRTSFGFLIFPAFIWVYLALIVYALIGGFWRSMEVSQRSPRIYVLLFLWGIGSILPPFILSQYVTPFYFFRYTIGSLGAFYLLFARGITILPRAALRLVAACVVLVGCFLSLQNYYYYSPHAETQWKESYNHFPRESWREVVMEIRRQIRANDFVMVSWGHKALFQYYAPDLRIHTFPNLEVTKEEQWRQIKRITNKKRRLWIILGFSPEPAQARMLSLLKERYQELNPNISIRASNNSSVHLFSLKLRWREHSDNSSQRNAISSRIEHESWNAILYDSIIRRAPAGQDR